MSSGTNIYKIGGGGGGGPASLQVGVTGITGGNPNSILFHNAATNVLDQASTFVFLKNTLGVGKLGIGTITPTNTLQVVGTATLQDILPEATNTYSIGDSSTYYLTGFINNIQTSVLRNVSDVGGFTFQSSIANPVLKFYTATQNLVVGGSLIDSGYRLDVENISTAGARISGKTTIGNFSTTPSAILEISSTTQGFLLPRLTNPQQAASSYTITNGAQVYNTTLNDISFRGVGTYVQYFPSYIPNAPIFFRKQEGTETFAVAANPNEILSGYAETVVYQSPYLLKDYSSNIITVNLFFEANDQTANDTFLSIYATIPNNFNAGGVKIGQYRITSAQYAAGLNSVAYTCTFFVQQVGTTAHIFYQNFSNNLVNQNFQKRPLERVSLGGGAGGFILYKGITITATNLSYLRSVQVTFAE